MKIKVSVSMGLVGCEKEDVIEIDAEDLEGLDQKGREAVAEEYAREWMWEHVDFGWEEIEG